MFHEIYCATQNKCKIVLPKGKFLKFTNYNRKERVPIIIYADNECNLRPSLVPSMAGILFLGPQSGIFVYSAV